MPDAHANLATSLVTTAPSPAASGTSLTVTSGQGSRFPTPPFNATCWPAGQAPDPTNAEIVRVTARTGDTFTITRAQEGTTAQAIAVGYQIVATITAKTLQDLEVGYPTFIQTTGPTGAQTSGLTKWVWVDTSTYPPTIKVEAAGDTATSTLSSTSADDVLVQALMGVLG